MTLMPLTANVKCILQNEKERESPNISFLPLYVGCGEIFVFNGVNVAKFGTRQKRQKKKSASPKF